MTLPVQLTIIFLGIVLLIAILHATLHRKISESHALLWIVPCLLIILGGIFPQLTYALSKFFNTEYPPAIIFAIAIIILFFILFQCFKVLSVLSIENKELASQLAVLQLKNKELADSIAKISHEGKKE